MYMPDAKTQRQEPNATYIPLAGVGVLRRDKRKFYIFPFFSDTNMLVSPTQNSGVGGLSQRQGLTQFFASQWNIGFSFFINYIFGQITLVKYCLLQVKTVQYFNILLLGNFTKRISNSLVGIWW